MDELTVIEVTSDGIVAVSRDGQRFLLPLNSALRASLGQKISRVSPSASGATPKDIQQLLRSGLTVAEVAERTGLDSDHVERFEAPVAAELAFILERAMSVPVHGVDAESTFGDEITARIAEQGGRIERWQSYRVGTEWVVGARFSIGAVEEDATWGFDSRKMTLQPTNQAAVRLSSADSVDAALFPPLRVVQPDTPSRFDSGEFEPIVVPQPVTTSIEVVVDVPTREPAAHEPEPPAPVELLDAINRRRGERNDAIANHPSTGSIPIITPDMLEMPDDSPIAPVDLPEVDVDAVDPPTSEVPPVVARVVPVEPDAANPPEAEPFIDPNPSRSRRQRAQMPTWDEIVFGTRPEDK